MSSEVIFRAALLALFVGFVAHRGYYTRKQARLNQTITTEGSSGRAEKFINLLAMPGLLAVALYIINPEWMAWAAVSLPLWLRVAGIGIALFGFGLLQWSQNTLGENWSDDPHIRDQHQLIESGPYRRIRHPIYTAFLLIMASTFFISSNWFIGLVWFGMTAIDVAVRVRTEEGMLEAEFGERYQDYEARTGRLFPKLVQTRGG